MKLELTRRERVLIIFFLSLLVLGATIHLIRTGGSWTQPAETVAKQ